MTNAVADLNKCHAVLATVVVNFFRRSATTIPSAGQKGKPEQYRYLCEAKNKMAKAIDTFKENRLHSIEDYAAMLNYQPQSLAQTFLMAWQEAHGTPSGSASVLTGSDTIAILIEDTLTKAEFALAQKTEGQVILQRYIETVFDQLGPELIGSVEAVSGRRVIQKCVSVSLKCGWIICLFKLDQPGPLNGG